jgi:hypothetical protein
MKLTVKERMDQTDLSEVTILSWDNIFREKISFLFQCMHMRRIGGANTIVEIDEAHLYTNKKRIGRRLVGEKIWIVAGICRETKEMFFDLTRVRSSSYLSQLIVANVLPETKIITDGWRGYNNVGSLGYLHEVINHTIMFARGENNEIHTNTIERFWRDLRSNIPSNIRFDDLREHVHKYMVNRIWECKTCIVALIYLLDCLLNKL